MSMIKICLQMATVDGVKGVIVAPNEARDYYLTNNSGNGVSSWVYKDRVTDIIDLEVNQIDV